MFELQDVEIENGSNYIKIIENNYKAARSFNKVLKTSYNVEYGRAT